MQQTLINHITSLLNLTKEEKVKPIDFYKKSSVEQIGRGCKGLVSNTTITIKYDGIKLLLDNNYLRIIVSMENNTPHVIEDAPSGLIKLFKDTWEFLENKKNNREVMELDSQLTDIIKKITR